MLNGEVLSEAGEALDRSLTPGWHELRCRVQVSDAAVDVVELQSWIHVSDELLEWQAVVPLEGLTLNKDYPLVLSWQGPKAAKSFRLMKGYHVLAEAQFPGTSVELLLDPKALGEGPSRIHWEVSYEKGREIRGPSCLVTVR